MRKIPFLVFAGSLALSVALANSAQAQSCRDVFSVSAYELGKAEIKTTLAFADRTKGLRQITGKTLVVGQTEFPQRAPADPAPFYDQKTHETLVYGTNVDGTGFSYLKFKSQDDFLRGAEPQLIAKEVRLPNGRILQGQEAIWDTYRLSYSVLSQVFSRAQLERSYLEHGLDKESDLIFGGVALQQDGSLGRWTTDNWRRRIHAIVEKKGELAILEEPVFNPIEEHKSETAYPGFGQLPFLPGDYIGHTYGPNFKLVRRNGKLELWIITEEVTRRVQEKNGPTEVTEIVARKMLSPFEASEEKITLVSVNGADGQPHPDSDRGPELGHAKLIEGFRPTSVTPEGLRITKREVIQKGRHRFVTDSTLAKDEFFVMTGSQGNFAGDGYDSILAVRKGSPIGPYKMVSTADGKHWKKYLSAIKKRFHLSWAGRAAFVFEKGGWWLVFHAVDKDLKPDGSYTGVIPPNTAEYHRNLYAVPIEFYVNVNGDADMRVLP